MAGTAGRAGLAAGVCAGGRDGATVSAEGVVGGGGGGAVRRNCRGVSGDGTGRRWAAGAVAAVDRYLDAAVGGGVSAGGGDFVFVGRPFAAVGTGVAAAADLSGNGGDGGGGAGGGAAAARFRVDNSGWDCGGVCADISGVLFWKRCGGAGVRGCGAVRFPKVGWLALGGVAAAGGKGGWFRDLRGYAECVGDCGGVRAESAGAVRSAGKRAGVWVDAGGAAALG